MLAERYPATKFLRIVSTDCIPQYPDRNLPTVLVYKDTKCLQTLVGLLHYGGRRLTPERANVIPKTFACSEYMPKSCVRAAQVRMQGRWEVGT